MLLCKRIFRLIYYYLTRMGCYYRYRRRVTIDILAKGLLHRNRKISMGGRRWRYHIVGASVASPAGHQPRPAPRRGAAPIGRNFALVRAAARTSAARRPRRGWQQTYSHDTGAQCGYRAARSATAIVPHGHSHSTTARLAERA